MTEALIVLAAALAVDLFMGEPPSSIHPVVWIGRLQGALRRLAPTAPMAAFAFGTGMAVVGPALFGLGSGAVLSLLAASGVVRIVVAVYLLKSALAVRGLAAAAGAVQRALDAADPSAARVALRSLVSRDTSRLDASEMAGAAIESVAENTSDSVVAPLFYYLVGGVPAALAYRAVNTLDAMIGYHGETEWLGKAAARLDDAANFLPARITALLIAIAAPAASQGSSGRAFALWMRDARATESPNAGRPMAAMAGALGVELKKEGAYTLGVGLRAPQAGDIRGATGIFGAAVVLAVALAVVILIGRG